MMLAQRLNVLAHDLAKQCQVTGQGKSEGRSSFKKRPQHSAEEKDDNTKSKIDSVSLDQGVLNIGDKPGNKLTNKINPV